MLPSSTSRLLGFSALVIQPFRLLPSKRRSQPSFFSFSDRTLSEAGAAATSPRKIRMGNSFIWSLPFVGDSILSWAWSHTSLQRVSGSEVYFLIFHLTSRAHFAKTKTVI